MNDYGPIGGGDPDENTSLFTEYRLDTGSIDSRDFVTARQARYNLSSRTSTSSSRWVQEFKERYIMLSALVIFIVGIVLLVYYSGTWLAEWVRGILVYMQILAKNKTNKG